MASNTDKDALTANLADARTRMNANFRALRYDLQVLPRIKANITRNPLAWFSVAVIIGLLLSKIPSTRHDPKVEIRTSSRAAESTEKAGKAAVVLTALKFALDFAKPALLRYLTQRIGEYGRRPHS